MLADIKAIDVNCTDTYRNGTDGLVPQPSRSEFTSFQSPIQELLHVFKRKICCVFKDLLGMPWFSWLLVLLKRTFLTNFFKGSYVNF